MSLKSIYIISALFFGGIAALLIQTSMERKDAEARDQAISKANAERASAEADRAMRDLGEAMTNLDIVTPPSAKPNPDLMLMMRQNVEQMELFCRQGIPDSCEQAQLQRKHYNELAAIR